MKRSLLLPILFLCLMAKAQDMHLVKILDEDHRLERNCNKCQNKITLPVGIPPHTGFIYLAISVNKTGQLGDIGLYRQLQGLINAKPLRLLGELKPIISQIQGCEKGGTINFYVATEGRDESPNMFDRDKGYVCDYSKCKIDFPGGPAGFQVVQSEDKLTYYFGFDNASTNEAIFFHVEAVAVTRDY